MMFSINKTVLAFLLTTCAPWKDGGYNHCNFVSHSGDFWVHYQARNEQLNVFCAVENVNNQTIYNVYQHGHFPMTRLYALYWDENANKLINAFGDPIGIKPIIAGILERRKAEDSDN